MHGSHQAALDAPFVVQDFGNGCQTVGSARRIGDDGLTFIGGVVYAVDKHGSVVFGGRRHQHLFSASSQVFFRGGFV